MSKDVLLYEGDTAYGHYQVVETNYYGRPARVLFSGNRAAAQSGVALDDSPELLFDYNQRFLELIEGLQPRRILLIGGGACTLPAAIAAVYPRIRLDVVEIDGQLIDLAEAFFDFHPSDTVKVHVAEGRKYLATTTQKYDLIVVDAFTHTTAPASLQTVEAAQAMLEHLRPCGVIAINVIASLHGLRSQVLRRQLAAFEANNAIAQLFPADTSANQWLPVNLIVTATRDRADVADSCRYKELALATTTADTRHDSDTPDAI